MNFISEKLDNMDNPDALSSLYHEYFRSESPIFPSCEDDLTEILTAKFVLMTKLLTAYESAGAPHKIALWALIFLLPVLPFLMHH